MVSRVKNILHATQFILIQSIRDPPLPRIRNPWSKNILWYTNAVFEKIINRDLPVDFPSVKLICFLKIYISIYSSVQGYIHPYEKLKFMNA